MHVKTAIDAKIAPPCRPVGRRWAACRFGVALVAVALSSASGDGGEPAPIRSAHSRPASARSPSMRTTPQHPDHRENSRGPKVDHAVKQAAASEAGPPKCSHCQRSACPHCQPATARQHAHSPCQHGLCPAHCPVRPDVFGFYGTRWRKWPGAGVVPASSNEEIGRAHV